MSFDDSMRDRDDAMGHLLWDHYHGKAVREVVERDDGYLDVGESAAFYFAEYRAWPAWERRAMRYVRGRVLDVGCGAGRLSLYLQSQGFRVTAIDTSPLAVRVCRLRGVRRARVMSFHRLDFPPDAFDTVVFLGNNFGLFASRARARRLLRRLGGLTTPGARIIAETLDPHKTRNPAHLAYHRRNTTRGRMPGQVRIRVRHESYTTPWFDYLFLSKSEMKHVLRGTGWSVETFVDSGGPSYIAVLHKAA